MSEAQWTLQQLLDPITQRRHLWVFSMRFDCFTDTQTTLNFSVIENLQLMRKLLPLFALIAIQVIATFAPMTARTLSVEDWGSDTIKNMVEHRLSREVAGLGPFTKRYPKDWEVFWKQRIFAWYKSTSRDGIEEALPFLIRERRHLGLPDYGLKEWAKLCASGEAVVPKGPW